jgi:hypothetical protein
MEDRMSIETYEVDHLADRAQAAKYAYELQEQLDRSIQSMEANNFRISFMTQSGLGFSVRPGDPDWDAFQEALVARLRRLTILAELELDT